MTIEDVAYNVKMNWNTIKNIKSIICRSIIQSHFWMELLVLPLMNLLFSKDILI